MRQTTQLTKDKFLNQSELNYLRALLARDHSRNGIFISLALSTGARVTELLNVVVDDLNKVDQSIYIRGLKNSNDRTIPINPELYSKLQTYVDYYCTSNDETVFDFSYDRLYQIWQDYKPGPKKFHSLRHTFAIELYKRTKDIKLVQTALGHKSINTTMIYMDYLYSIEELKKLILN